MSPKYWLYWLRRNCPNLYIRYLPRVVNSPMPSYQYFDLLLNGSFGKKWIGVRSPCLWTTCSCFRVEMSWFGHKYTTGIEHNSNRSTKIKPKKFICFANIVLNVRERVLNFFSFVKNFIIKVYFSYCFTKFTVISIQTLFKFVIIYTILKVSNILNSNQMRILLISVVMNVPTFYNRWLWNVVKNKMSKQKILKEKIYFNK